MPLYKQSAPIRITQDTKVVDLSGLDAQLLLNSTELRRMEEELALTHIISWSFMGRLSRPPL
jgi:hypothetical protein